MLKSPAWAAPSATEPLAPFTIERREPGPHEVLIDIRYCGVCHSDLRRGRKARSRCSRAVNTCAALSSRNSRPICAKTLHVMACATAT